MRRLSFSAEMRIQKNIQNKRQLGSRDNSNFELFSDHNPPKQMFEHFLILGHSSEESRKPKPQLLAMFPSRPLIYNSAEINEIINFCYPQGFEPISSSFPISLANVSGKNGNIITGFVFYLTINNKIIYGISLHIRVPQEANSFLGPQYSRKYPYCLCLLTRQPFMSSHFTFLNDIAEGIIGNVQLPDRSVPIPEGLKNAEGKCHPSLILNQKCPLIAIAMGVRVPRFLLPQLLTYYQTQISTADAMQTIDYLLYPTLHTLFSNFSSREMVKVYTALLFELHTVFVSSDLNKLSFSVIAATNLLTPLQIESKVIPILPTAAEFRPFFESPFSYVIGYPSKCDNFDISADIIIDIDRGKVIENVPLPSLPGYSDLSAKIDLLLSNYSVQITAPPKTSLMNFLSKSSRFNAEYLSFIAEIDHRVFPECFREFVETRFIFRPTLARALTKIFANHFVPSLKEYIRMCFVTDSTIRNQPVTVFNRDLFQYHIPEKMNDFFQAFINTQMFQQFVDRLTDEEQMKKSPSAEFGGTQKQRNRLRKFARMSALPKNKSLPAILLPDKRPSIFSI